jgi:antitoxin (DNA-binding transcriptional repressor) of toxin-antitoxin stability system
MTLVALEDTGVRLKQLIQDAQDGEEIIIMRGNDQIAKIVPINPDAPRPRFGSAKDVSVYMTDDFDATPEDFKD